jgi:hypothetical protein
MEYVTDILQPFAKYFDSKCFDYYLLEIDRDGDAKVIDSSIIKERLEAKAEKYNELALEDKKYWKWEKVAHKYEVKTLEKGFYDREEN